VVAVLLVARVICVLRRPKDPEKAASMIERMGKVASSPAAVVGAGAALANPGAFIALKTISEPDPSDSVHRRMGLRRCAAAAGGGGRDAVGRLVRAGQVLAAARTWLGTQRADGRRGDRPAASRAALLRNGIAGLTG
jgi:hypothetical protein